MQKRLTPFIKWAGGKEQELVHIIPNMPEYYNRYLEPFVGGGAVYFSIKNKNMIINDKSKELVDLYKMLQEENEEFHNRINAIYDNWKVLENIIEKYSQLFVQEYKDYSNDKIDKSQLDDFMIKFILNNADEFNGILSPTFNTSIENFIREIKKNLVRRTGRMKTLEQQRGKLPDNDIIKNIETAFKSAYYMHFRYLYNNSENFNIDLPFHTAIFYFIREYCYASMFRYNKQGEFNVPYGGMSYNRKDFGKKINYIKSPKLISHLKKTKIYNLDFEDFFKAININKDDFMFIDPPYDSEFSDYVGMSFTSDDHIRLANCLYDMDAKFMLVIKNTKLIRELYLNKGFNISAFDKKYLVSFQNRNDKDTEHLLITNY